MPDLQPFTRVLGVPWFYPAPKPLPVLKQAAGSEKKTTRNSKALDWTAEQDRRIRQEYPTHNTEALAKELGRTSKQVRARATYLVVSKDRKFINTERKKTSAAYQARRKNNVAMVDGV